LKKRITMAVLLLLFSVVMPFVLAQDENTAGVTPTGAEPPEVIPGSDTDAPMESPTPLVTPGEIPMPTVTSSEAAPEADGINPDTNQPVVDEQTGKQIAAMQLGLGARVRLLELERAVTRNTLKGRKVVEFIQETDSNADVSELEAILAELESLEEEIAAVQPQANSDETVKQFVDLKNDAISLSKEFRDTARGMLEGMDKSGLAAKFKEIDWSELSALNEQIKQLIREYNAQRVERVFQNIEGKAPAFVQRIRTGELSVKQVRAELGKAFKSLKPAKRNEALLKLRQLNAKRRVFKQAKTAVARLNFLERRANRLENRIQRIEQNPKFKAIMNKLRSRINSRITGSRPRGNRQGTSKVIGRRTGPLSGIAQHRRGA